MYHMAEIFIFVNLSKLQCSDVQIIFIGTFFHSRISHNAENSVQIVDSHKVKQSFNAKFLAGERISVYAPFGYKKHPEIKNKIIPDEDTAPIVIKMFEMVAHGTSVSRIVKYLVEERIPTPGYWNYVKYGGFAHHYENTDKAKNNYLWRFAQVQNILRDETYIGDTVHFRMTTVSYKNKKSVRNPKEKWMTVEKTHEPIVTKEMFELVQQQMESRKRPQKNGATQIFAGLLKCADCGKTMRFCRHTQHGKYPYDYYCCRYYANYGIEICSQHYLRYDVLYPYVLSRIQYWANERITEYNFNMMSVKYQAEQEELDERTETLQAEIAAEGKATCNAEKWIELIKQYSNSTELTAEMLNTLIERIDIHEAKVNDFGEKEQIIDIYYRFVGKID